MKCVFCVNNLTPTIKNTWYEIIHIKTDFIHSAVFMQTHSAYSTSNPFFLTPLSKFF